MVKSTQLYQLTQALSKVYGRQLLERDRTEQIQRTPCGPGETGCHAAPGISAGLSLQRFDMKAKKPSTPQPVRHRTIRRRPCRRHPTGRNADGDSRPLVIWTRSIRHCTTFSFSCAKQGGSFTKKTTAAVRQRFMLSRLFWMFVAAFRPALMDNLQVPILTLQDALAGLNNNAVAPILEPVPRRGRSPSNVLHAVMRGHAAATVTKLMEIGFGRDEALSEVAKVVAQLGIRPERGSGVVKASTVRSWCNEVSSDVGRHGEAARQYDCWITKPDERREEFGDVERS